MTHPKNYEYQMRWRARNREKYLNLKMADTLKRNYYKQTIKEFMRIDTTLFLQESLGVSYKTNNIFFSLN